MDINSEQYKLARLYGDIWERYFEGKFVVKGGEKKAIKELLNEPRDVFIDRAMEHCRDLWHQTHCKGSIYCFAKNYNSFSIPKKPKEIRHRVPCRTCGEDFWLDQGHDCGTDVEVLNPNEAISTLMKKYELPR